MRIIVKPKQVQDWLAERHGMPTRRRGSDADLLVTFDQPNPDYQLISMEELIEIMKFHRLVMLVDQETGQTFNRIYQHD